MKVFISWSGGISHKFALALKDWLPNVIQKLKPFVSSEDIEKGSIWFGEIGEKLGKDYQFGILCLTPLNYKEPWILFEAGALYKGLPDKTRVSPFLLGLKNADLVGPLSNFNTTIATKDDVKRLLTTLNNLLGESKLNEKTLDATFIKFWPDIEPAINDALNAIKDELEKDKTRVIKRDQYEIIEEILETTRNISQGLSKKESFADISQVLTAVSSPSLLGYTYPVSGGLLGRPALSKETLELLEKSGFFEDAKIKSKKEGEEE